MFDHSGGALGDSEDETQYDYLVAAFRHELNNLIVAYNDRAELLGGRLRADLIKAELNRVIRQTTFG